eukprot:1331555-Amorphochlora_amoeboformis.AAC.2
MSQASFVSASCVTNKPKPVQLHGVTTQPCSQRLYTLSHITVGWVIIGTHHGGLTSRSHSAITITITSSAICYRDFVPTTLWKVSKESLQQTY